MSWSDHAIWWHLQPLGFLGAERTALPPGEPPRHRLPALADWLDHLIALGCNGLALGPVFASETHGYDTTDHFRIDPRLGTEKDLTELVERAASRGVRVLLDGVFNHVGRSFGPFADVARHGTASAYADWFVPEGDDFRTFEGHRHLVALNHASPAVADHVVAVLDHWLDRGVSGWRLDAAYAVPPAFWRTVTDRVRARHPEAWFSGEVIHGDYAGYVTEGGLDSVTQYELWKAIWSSLNDANPHELAWTLRRHNAMLDVFAPQTFVGNHDVTRIASRLREPGHLAHALTVLFTVGGIPSVYAGDERAWQGVKEDREGGDDAIRPAFPADPSGLGAEGLSVQRLHQSLVGIRRRHSWLVRARTQVHTLGNAVLTYTADDPGTGAAVAVALNFGTEPAAGRVPPAHWTHAAGDPVIDPATGSVSLPPLGWSVATAAGT
ncbi:MULTISPECIES: alpha-amylase family protein [Streptomyces]|uniref:Alpha-amylase family protein n=1 Tax=Streptomyces plumbiresistens TaxID=511811 RepID=A0ABP7RP56_9ACTN|nr:alpha-amylase family protein [Streptomyces sp. NBC_01373]MCX4701921.1 alpha-amylase family protein [Streptomyces sp. NBC_01373]